MPNECTNLLSITGPTADVARFRAAVEAANDCLVDAFVPFPEELHGDPIVTKDGISLGRSFTDEGWNWALENWGTKWGDYETHIISSSDNSDGTSDVAYRFISAWTPPLQALTTIAGLFPSLYFEICYEEDNMAILGGAIFREGKLLGVVNLDEAYWPDLPELPDGDYDYQAYEDAKEELRQKVDDKLHALLVG
jgi:hypothetical protein